MAIKTVLLKKCGATCTFQELSTNYRENKSGINVYFHSLNSKELIKKLNAKRLLKHIYKKVNDVSALRYAIIKLRSEKV